MTGGRHHGGSLDGNRHGGGRDGRRYRNRSLERRFDDSGSSHRPYHGGRRHDDDDRQPSQRRRRVDDAYFRDEDLEGRCDRHRGDAIGRRHGERRDGGRRRDSNSFEEAFDSNRDWRRNDRSHRGGHRDRRHPPTDGNRRGGEDRRHFREDPPLHGHSRLDSRRPPSYGKRSRQVASVSPLRADNPRDASSLRHSRSPDSVTSNASSIHHYRYDCGGQSSSFKVKVKAEDPRGGSSVLPQQEEMPPSYEEFARKHQSRVFTYLNDSVLPTSHPVSTAAAEEQQRTDGVLAAAPEVPPDSIVRVALYGVDLSVTSAHLNSMAEQVLGAAPWRVRRPALEVLASLAGSDGANLMGSSTAAAGASGEEAAKAIAPQPGCDAVLMEGYIGEETPGTPVGQRHNAVIPDPSGGGSSGAANPFLFMPGLRDVSGAGGMVVLEFVAAEVASKALKLFNGATINGRHIVASM